MKKLAAKVFGDIKNDLPRFVRYVFWGAITAFFNLGVYLLLTNTLGLHYLVSNTVAWVLYVVAAFFTNKLYVFGTRGQTGKQVAADLGRFAGSRLATCLLENVMLFVFVTLLHGNKNLTKIIASATSAILNYLVSCLIIFSKKNSAGERR